MSVPQLVALANEVGYRTNSGETYRGGRGSYHLVRSAYNFFTYHQKTESAHKIAMAFMKPNFTYAYQS